MARSLTVCGTEFFFDDCFAADVAPYSWRIDKDGYVERRTTINGKKGSSIRLHRVVMRASEGEIVDHIDGNKLNNTRANLRYATKSENSSNSFKRDGLSSRFKGVTWNKKCGKWQAQIGKSKHIYLGLFDSEHEAAHAYNKAAVELHGEFCRLNLVGEPK